MNRCFFPQASALLAQYPARDRLDQGPFDIDPYLEWVDLMQHGFWGEGKTSNFPNPFPDRATALRTLRDLTALQLETWKRTPLAVNTQR